MADALDAVIWGFGADGRPFRPSDWCDRLAGLTAVFGQERKVVYSPLVLEFRAGALDRPKSLEPPQSAGASRDPA